MGFPNKYPGTCIKCGSIVPAFGGELVKTNDHYNVVHPEGSLFCRQPAEGTVHTSPLKPSIAIGDMKGILGLFEKAKAHLKRPAIVLAIDGVGEVRLSLAGERAKQPGTVNVADAKPFGDGLWYGRVQRNGSYEPSRDGMANRDTITAKLKAFAADPAGVASEHGRLTGRCCFCNLKLTDERSTATGYGQTCAKHYDLPWGQRPKAFAEAV